ncbi:MAG: hypothetical protein H7Y38_14515 [Armatimonadetes bacterium]|nr:hypothetical protein [Armatimonadota bacterium]
MIEGVGYLTLEQAAKRKSEQLGRNVPEITIKYAGYRGKLRYRKDGDLNRLLYRPEDVDAWTPREHGGERPGAGRKPKQAGE